MELMVDKPEALGGALARLLEGEVAAALAARGRYALALPGGSVATRFFPTLAAAAVDWTRVDFFWGDERAVPPDDPESNFGLADRLWLRPAGVPPERIHRMPADAEDLEAAAASHAAELARVAGAPPRLDLVLLGVGPDGHVCSLFPGHAALAETGRSVVAVRDSPKPPPRRLTLTLPVLAAAGRLVVAGFGSSKAAVLREAVEDEGSALPVALALRRSPRALALLDAEAASRLRDRKG
jgi:6-phosphogluconolactonase